MIGIRVLFPFSSPIPLYLWSPSDCRTGNTSESMICISLFSVYSIQKCNLQTFTENYSSVMMAGAVAPPPNQQSYRPLNVWALWVANVLHRNILMQNLKVYLYTRYTYVLYYDANIYSSCIYLSCTHTHPIYMYFM